MAMHVGSDLAALNALSVPHELARYHEQERRHRESPDETGIPDLPPQAPDLGIRRGQVCIHCVDQAPVLGGTADNTVGVAVATLRVVRLDLAVRWRQPSEGERALGLRRAAR